MRVGDTLAAALSGLAREIARGSGPVKWCSTCGRKHPRRASCGLVMIERRAKSGRMVSRWAQPH